MPEPNANLVETLFEQARRLPIAEQTAFLESHCADEAVRREVVSLLRHDAESFLSDRSPIDVLHSSFLTDAPEDIDGYAMGDKLGAGGLGIVYLAEQHTPFHRTVAIKLIKLGMDTHEVLMRFDAERQALAQLNHPNIARVYDAGSTRTGRPYFVMEYVDGQPIREFCDDRLLNTDSRIALFQQVCMAVHHAHGQGFVHRDLKPSNILVHDGGEDGPTPKVIDFGIAKSIAQGTKPQTMFTEAGKLIGTLEYMSPEQALADADSVDARSDVYSLGVVLYQLLTGHLPFERRRAGFLSYEALCRDIRTSEPGRPSSRIEPRRRESGETAKRRGIDARSLQRTLRGDLDWIVMRALERDPARRYASARELAEDLQRYLRKEPVEAGPPSLTYRFSKYVRRRWLLSSAVGASVLVAVSMAVLFFPRTR